MKKIKFSIIIPAQKIHDYLREAMVYYINQNFKDFEIIILSDINEKDKLPKTRIIKTQSFYIILDYFMCKSLLFILLGSYCKITQKRPQYIRI